MKWNRTSFEESVKINCKPHTSNVIIDLIKFTETSSGIPSWGKGEGYGTMTFKCNSDDYGIVPLFLITTNGQIKFQLNFLRNKIRKKEIIKDYQLKLVDIYCNHQNILSKFKSQYQSYLTKQKELNELIKNENQLSKEFDYKQFLFDELEEAKLTIEDTSIEEELNKLENFEEIQKKLNHVMMISENSDSSVSTLISNIVSSLDSIKKNDSKIDALS